MLKRFFLALALFAGLLSPSHAAGTMAFSLSQQFDSLGNPLNGGKLYFFQAGTTTPQNAYSDSGLTLALPNPITLDSAGRVPQFFLADGTIKIRLTNSAGVTQVSADGIMVIGASSGTGSGSVVDATTVLAVGDIKVRYGTGALTGFVRANGRTIGSATSGATERANSDCQELFEYLWAEDTTLAVSTGRGASAAADWTANKTLALPDGRGRALAGLNDMGNTNASILAPASVTKGDTITLGSLMGYGASRTLLTANLPAYTPTGTVADTRSWSSSTVNGSFGLGTISTTTVGSGFSYVALVAGSGTSATITNIAPVSGTVLFSGSSQGGSSTAFDTISPLMLITTYIKL